MDRIIDITVNGSHITKNGKKAGVRGEGNVTSLRIAFSEDWDGFEKKLIFWDARGENPTEFWLTADWIEDIVKDRRVYLVPIPHEPLKEAGSLTFVIEGDVNAKTQRSLGASLEVLDAPVTDNAEAPENVTPSQAEQLQAEIEAILGEIQGAAKARDEAIEAKNEAIEAKEDIENMSVSCETLSTGEEAFVEKTVKDGVVILHYGLPAGGKGDKGDSGVYVGADVPKDEDVSVWIDPNGDPSEIIGSSILNVKSLGAIGDGEADDTEALKTAAACGVAVYFPRGTYILREEISMSKSVNWIGDGVGSVIKFVQVENNGVSCKMLSHTTKTAYSISLQGISLDANNTGTMCLNLVSPAAVYMNNVKISGATHNGCFIYGGSSTDVSISNCRFSNNGSLSSNEQLGSGLEIENIGIDARVTNCELNNNGVYGLSIKDNNGCVVSNVVCNGNGHGGVGIIGGSSGNTLTGIRCSSSYCGVVIALDGSNNIDEDENEYCENNTISGLVTKGNEYGVMFGNCVKTIISGWNSVGDLHGYCIGYGGNYKDITGAVFALFTTSSAESYTERTTTDKFKIQFIGR